MQMLRKILFPFSILYGGIMLARNELYNRNILKTHQYDLPIICVGNLSVGGTGKSPMVEYLIRLLGGNYHLATLSRGYKRSTTGFHLLKGDETAAEVGDEPLQFKVKHKDVTVAVDEVRSHGIEELLKRKSPEVIILDDAFQHRKVTAGLNIILTPYEKPYFRDFMLPTGNLREPVRGIRRAHLIIVTKCPATIDAAERKLITNELGVGKDQCVFFTKIGYSKEILGSRSSVQFSYFQGKQFTLVTGIANPRPLVDYLKSLKLDFRHLAYPDHHDFTDAELQELKEQELILTTEKDFMRLKGSIKQNLFYIPITTEFITQGKEFDDLVNSYVKRG